MLGNTINNNINNKETKTKCFLTINDLREKDYSNKELSPQERLAIKNFDRYRIIELNKQTSESKFHIKYMQIQVMANLSPYEEFLKEAYFF
ncbi:MAG: hypothetical protein CO118_04145 [Flavobacteriales bacterium CG_4_9_14_3_um_filter_32_8]|nr:MAG: hypothetical protein CO118_04145 [Flavobacteriales bacterium CG_4_9_14_3_um_filter_32_8]